jgi:hypothetical protein
MRRYDRERKRASAEMSLLYRAGLMPVGYSEDTITIAPPRLITSWQI